MTTTNQPSDAAMELKACPFCGGEAMLFSYLLEATVTCTSCGVEVTEDHGAKLDDKTGDVAAITAWNTRDDRHLTRAPAEPVAWLYEIPGAMVRYAYTDRRPCEKGWTETPLYATPPAPVNSDAGLVERVARAICSERDGIDWDMPATEYDCDLARAALSAIPTPAVNAALVEQLRKYGSVSIDGNIRGPALQAASTIQSLTTRIAELEAEIAEAELRGARLMQEAAAEAPQRVRDKYWLAPIPCAYCEAEIRALDPAVIISRATLTETSHDR